MKSINIKKSLKDVVVLVAICAVFALALAYVNSITAPIIEKGRLLRANEAYIAVMPGAEGFENVDLTTYNNLPASVVAAKKEVGGMGYAVEVNVTGYKPGMVVIVGVTNDGIVTGAKCTESSETNGVEKSYGDKFVGLGADGVDGVDIVAASTMTSNGYKKAVSDAITTVAIFGGANIDARPEEVKFAEKLDLALPAANGEFNKVLLVVTLDGIDAVYEAVNGEGYVCLIGSDSTGTFIGVGKDGVAVGDVSAEHKALAEAAIETVKANTLEDVDLSEYQNNEFIKNNIISVQKTAGGTYIVETKATGYNGSAPIVIRVAVNADGIVIDLQTVSHSETPNYGGVKLEGGYYNDIFVGKDEAGSGDVDFDTLKNGATISSKGVQQAVSNAFNAIKILGGEDVDTRTEAEKFADAISAALPAGEGKFTKYFRVEVIEGIDSIYVADNGAGYVCVFGTDSTGVFVGVDADGVALGEVSDEHKALVEAAVATIKASTLTDLEIAHLQTSEDREIKRIFRNISYAKKTATGNYVFEIKSTGYSSTPMMIIVSISADGKLLDIKFESHSESANYGKDKIEGGYYNEIFAGKDATGSEAIDFDTLKNGSTVTSKGVQKAIVYCFGAVTILEGGTN